MKVEHKTPLPDVVITLSNDEAKLLREMLYEHARWPSLHILHDKLRDLTA